MKALTNRSLDSSLLVPIEGFDELMTDLQDTLELGVLDEFFSTRGDERAARYVANRKAISQVRSAHENTGLQPDEGAPLEAARTEVTRPSGVCE